MKNVVLTEKEINPLQSIEIWEDDVLERYPIAGETAKAQEEYRNYDNPVRDTVREFYRLNHQYQTYDFVYSTLSRRYRLLCYKAQYLMRYRAVLYNSFCIYLFI